MTEPEPERELTPLEHPRFAVARAKSRIRLVLAIAGCVFGLCALLFLKQESAGEQAQIAAAQAAEKAKIAAYNAQLAPALVRQYHGESTDPTDRALVAKVGAALTQKSDASKQPLKLKFYLLAEPDVINLFTLPTGDIYLTTALLNRMQTEGQLAAVLAHGVAHALAGDMPETRFAENDPTKLTGWFYSLDQERAADKLAVALMTQAGYNPNAMIGMFTLQLAAYQAGADVAFFATHPNDANRLDQQRDAIHTLYPQGIPAVLSK